MADDDSTRALHRILSYYDAAGVEGGRRPSPELARMAAVDTAKALELGSLALRSGHPEISLKLADHYIGPGNASPEAWLLQADACAALNEPARALDFYDRAIAMRPDYATAYARRGLVLLKRKDHRAALASCTKAVALDPGLASAWSALGRTFGKLKQHELAAAAYRRALGIDPELPFCKGRLLQHLLSYCSWNGVEALISEIAEDMAEGREAARPFVWQAVSSSPQSLQRCAALFNRAVPTTSCKRADSSMTLPSRKLRIGYVSGEFRDHSVSYLRVGVFEHHDKERFETIAFDNGWDDGGAVRRRINAGMDRTVAIAGMNDAEAASMIEREQIDILVDLNGFYGLHRSGVFARRPAPVQATFPGYPGTLSAPHMDYIVADKIVLPEADQPYYSEKPVYLPDSYQANDDRKEISTGLSARSQFGLPDQGFVFCCFNNNYKILPAMFDIWARILKATPGSVLWLLADTPLAEANLRAQAERRGLDPARLVFAERMGAADHLARHRCADLFLDTLPYNAHTTASDALWSGLPVLTCLGTAFAGRVAASLLHAVALPELVTGNLEQYEAEAVRLAASPGRLSVLRERLVSNRPTMPLFDTALYTRHLEAAYLAMHERYRSGLPPRPITIPRLMPAQR